MKLKHNINFPLLIASDHAGFQLKEKLLEDKSLPWQDLGCFHKERTDYPDWADKLCRQMTENINKAKSLKSVSEPLGVLICGTGQGMVIRANRWASLRASLCWNQEIAFLARNHNQANVLCLPANFINKDQALNILQTFLETKFNPEVSYKRRVEKTNQNPNDI